MLNKRNFNGTPIYSDRILPNETGKLIKICEGYFKLCGFVL